MLSVGGWVKELSLVPGSAASVEMGLLGRSGGACGWGSLGALRGRRVGHAGVPCSGKQTD